MIKHILVTGASGFIGSHLVAALLSHGFRVTAVVRDCEKTQRNFPDIHCLPCDFRRDHHPDDWLSRLEGVDAVINAVGIIGEERRQRFDDLHTRAPKALFDACKQAGVRKVIQISALGADAEAVSRYHLSKRAADEHLARSDLAWVILRPSIVYGPGAKSMGLFEAMATLPLIPLVGDGRQEIQPIHVADLVQAVLRCLAADGPNRVLIDAVGPEPMQFRELLQQLRQWLDGGRARFLSMPIGMVRRLAGVGGLLKIGPLDAEAVDMLQRGNSAAVEPFERRLGFRPRRLRDHLAATPALDADRWHARLYLLRPLLRGSIGAVWLWAGLVSAFLYPVQKSLQLLAEVGVGAAAAPWLLYGAAGLDIVLGIATWVGRRLPLVGTIQIGVMLTYTAILSLQMPELWLHPFGPLAKNLPLLVATLMMIALEKR